MDRGEFCKFSGDSQRELLVDPLSGMGKWALNLLINHKNTYDQMMLKLISCGAGALLIALGIGWIALWEYPQPSENKETVIASQAAEIYWMPVSGSLIRQQDLHVHIDAAGTAEAIQKAPLLAEIEGRLNKIRVNVGDSVKKGQVLFEIDDIAWRLACEQSKGKLAEALGELLGEVNADAQPQNFRIWRSYLEQILRQDTLLPLPEVKTLQEEMVLIRSKVKECFLTLQQKKLALEKCRIRTPISGIVSELQVRQGMLVSPGALLCQCVNLREMQVKAEILESDIHFIKKGAPVRLTFPVAPGQVFDGSVLAVEPVIQSEEKMGTVYIRFKNPAQQVKDGSFARALIEKEVHQSLRVVPREALLFRNERSLIFTIHAGKAKWAYVETGRQNDRWVEVKGEVAVGDTVITEGHYALAHDANVKLITLK